MLEQLRAQLAAATFSSTEIKNRAGGLAQRALDEVTAMGVVLTADTGAAASVVGAVALAKSTVNAQAVSATFSNAQKQLALGKLDQLSAQLVSLGLA